MNTTTQQTIEFTRICNDGNGNPRYVCHFLKLLKEEEKGNNWDADLSEKYKRAVKRAHKIGGRKYHNKSYGGGIVFQSYNIAETEKQIKDLLK
jgi:hypothetical protein